MVAYGDLAAVIAMERRLDTAASSQGGEQLPQDGFPLLIGIEGDGIEPLDRPLRSEPCGRQFCISGVIQSAGEHPFALCHGVCSFLDQSL